MKVIYLFLIVFFTGFGVKAQYLTEDNATEKIHKKPAWKSRVFYGGNFGLALGNVTYIEIAPNIGYKFTERFDAGLGISYLYYKESIQYQVNSGNIQTWEYKSKTYGANVFADYMLFDNLEETLKLNIGSIIAHTEFERLNVNAYSYDAAGNMINDGRTWINSFLVGGGIRQKLNERATVSLLVLYNLTEEAFTPYSNPVFKINFSF